jgi:hypothetical protein
MTRITAASLCCLFLCVCGDSEVDGRAQVDTIMHNGKVAPIGESQPVTVSDTAGAHRVL